MHSGEFLLSMLVLFCWVLGLFRTDLPSRMWEISVLIWHHWLYLNLSTNRDPSSV